jgi:hypothetical protein
LRVEWASRASIETRLVRVFLRPSSGAVESMSNLTFRVGFGIKRKGGVRPPR